MASRVRRCFDGVAQSALFKGAIAFFPNYSEATFDGTLEHVPKMGSFFDASRFGHTFTGTLAVDATDAAAYLRSAATTTLILCQSVAGAFA